MSDPTIGYDDTAVPADAGGAPKDAVDAQQQAFIEEADDAAKAAERNARQAKQRLDDVERKRAEQVAQQQRDNEGRPEVQRVAEVPLPSDVVAVSGPRLVSMETTEEDRLIRHKQMVRDHLRNADPDMTGGTGEPQVDPSTGLPEGHVPEGHQDAPMLANPDGGRDPAYASPVQRR